MAFWETGMAFWEGRDGILGRQGLPRGWGEQGCAAKGGLGELSCPRASLQPAAIIPFLFHFSFFSAGWQRDVQTFQVS